MSDETPDFDHAVVRRQAAVKLRDAAQAEIDQMTPIIASALILEGTKSRLSDDGEGSRWSVALVESTRETLSKEKLLEAGVTMEQIQKATTKSTSTSVRVTRAKS